jgi:hypothetical protein
MSLISPLQGGGVKEIERGENGAPEKSLIFWGKSLFGREGMGRKTLF